LPAWGGRWRERKSRLVPILAAAPPPWPSPSAAPSGGSASSSTRRTDNAFIAADKVTIAPLVDGYVAEVLVDDNQPVQPGQVLVRIDPASIKARLAQAEANAQALEAGVAQVDDKARLEQAMIAQKAAGVSAPRPRPRWPAEIRPLRRAGQAGLGLAPACPERSHRPGPGRRRVGPGQATLETERRAAQSLGSARDQSLAQAAAARAAADQTRIDLSRTEVRAPVAGVVGARAVRVGQYVRPGGALMSIVPLADAYVVANFKETQVSRLRIGQPVEIHADAYGKQVIKGHVDSFAPATGAEFALIPVENAVGNFTKITQRVPVRIAIDREPEAWRFARPVAEGEGGRDPADRPTFAESGQRSRQSTLAAVSPADPVTDAVLQPGAGPARQQAPPSDVLGADGSYVNWTKVFLGFGGMVLGQFMAMLDIQIVASSLTQIQSGIGRHQRRDRLGADHLPPGRGGDHAAHRVPDQDVGHAVVLCDRLHRLRADLDRHGPVVQRADDDRLPGPAGPVRRAR
jgi:membrane fusion protein (multidrug efflux system)